MPTVHTVTGLLIGSVWVFHGLYSKILDGIPRHRLIIERILGEDFANPATYLIGIGEIFMGLWIWAGKFRKTNAFLQTAGLICMNTVEIILARDLLISPAGMVALNLCFIFVIWWWALRASSVQQSELN